MNVPIRSTRAGRLHWGWVVLVTILVLGVVAALVLPTKMLHGSMRMPVSTSTEGLTRAAPGQPVDLVVQVQSVRPDGPARAWLLQSVSDSQYLRTGASVWIERSAQTKTVMGDPRDVAPDAVLQVHATATGRAIDHITVVDASQIVIITGFATVR